MTSKSRWKLAFIVAALLLVSLGGYAGYQSYLTFVYRKEIDRFADSAGRLEAMALFRKGQLWLYRIDGECHDTEFSGEYEGPFRVYRVFYLPVLGRPHRYATQVYVAAFNEQMRHMNEHPEIFGRHSEAPLSAHEPSPEGPNQRMQRVDR